MAGPSTASSSSLRFTHVASSPTNTECVAVAQLPLQPLQRCPSLSRCSEGTADVESTLNEHFPLKINSDWRAICECDSADIDITAVEPSIEKLNSPLNEACVEECSVEMTELTQSESDGFRMEIAMQTLDGDNCSVNECDEPESTEVIGIMPNLVDSELWKAGDVCGLQKVAPPVIAAIVDSSPMTDISLETSVVDHDTCLTDLPSEFVDNISSGAVSGAVPMATCITTCAPLVSTYRSDFGMSLALLPSLQLISTTSLLSNVTVVLVGGGDHSVTYTAPALLAPCDITHQHSSDWPAASSESDGVTHSMTVSGDTTSRCCHVSLTTSVCGHPLTSGQHVDRCVSTSVLSTPPSSDVAQVSSLALVTPPSQTASISKIVSQKRESDLHCLSLRHGRVTPAGRYVVTLPPHPALSPHVSVVCSSVVPLCTPQPSLTLVARVPVPFMADASGNLTVLPSRVTSLIVRDHVLGGGVKQGRRQSGRGRLVARTCYDLRCRQDDSTGAAVEEVSERSVECFHEPSVDSNNPVGLSMECGLSTVDETVASVDEKHEPLATGVPLSSARVVRCTFQSCSVESINEDSGLGIDCGHTTVGYDTACLRKHTCEPPVCPGVGGLYSTVPFPQTCCVVVSSLLVPRVATWNTSCSRPHRRRPSNLNPGLNNIIHRPSNMTPGINNNISGPSNITPGLNNIIPGPSNTIPGLSNIIHGPSNVTPWPSNITPGPSNIIHGQSNVTPGPSNIIHGPSNVTPGPSNITPGPSNIIHGQSNIIPSQSNITPGPSNITPGHSNITPGPSNVIPGPMNNVDHGYCVDITHTPSTCSCSFVLSEGSDPPGQNSSLGVGVHRCAALDPSLCSEGWRWVHDIPLETGRRHRLSLYPLPPVIMAPGVFHISKVWLRIPRLVISVR